MPERRCPDCGHRMGELQARCATDVCLAKRGVTLAKCQYCEGRGFVVVGLLPNVEDCDVCGGWGSLASDEPEGDDAGEQASLRHPATPQMGMLGTAALSARTDLF
jgi:hypothetical protein